jgi:hypothetical protein
MVYRSNIDGMIALHAVLFGADVNVGCIFMCSS